MFGMKKIITQLLIFILGTLSVIFSQDDVSLTIGNVDEDNQTIDILYSSLQDVAGFQFDISGIAITSIDHDIDGIDGIVDFGNNTVLGISMTGGTLLPATDSAVFLMTIHYFPYKNNSLLNLAKILIHLHQILLDDWIKFALP